MSEPHAPYDDATWVLLEQEINQAQLDHEISEALDQPVAIAVTTNSETEEQRLWISPAEVDVAEVRRVIAEHEPQPDWGVPTEVLDFRAVVEKVTADPSVTLSTEELQAAVKGLLTHHHYALSN